MAVRITTQPVALLLRLVVPVCIVPLPVAMPLAGLGELAERRRAGAGAQAGSAALPAATRMAPPGCVQAASGIASGAGSGVAVDASVGSVTVCPF